MHDATRISLLMGDMDDLLALLRPALDGLKLNPPRVNHAIEKLEDAIVIIHDSTRTTR
jgi:hypothetical protein